MRLVEGDVVGWEDGDEEGVVVRGEEEEAVVVV